MATPFEALDPNIIINAVENTGVQCSGLIKTLNSMENRVYMIEGEDKKKWVAKFYRPGRWSREAIEDEHAFIKELASDGLPTVEPVTLFNKNSIGEVNGFYWALFPHKEGRPPQEFWEDGLIKLGAFIAHIHKTGKQNTAPNRPNLNVNYYIVESIKFSQAYIPASLQNEYSTLANQLANKIAPLLNNIPMHRIHGDFHRGNIVSGASGMWLVDFDDMCIGPAIQDIWLIYPGNDPESIENRNLIVEGYKTIEEFDYDWLKLIEPLRTMRIIYYSAWIAKRFDDPAFKKYFPSFGTLEYWQSELTVLKEQLSKINA